VFVSHSSRLEPDHEELIDSIVVRLGRRGVEVFWDRTRLRGGEPLLQSLEHAISSSRLAVVFLSRRSQASSFVALEIDEIIRRLRGGQMRVLVLRLERGCKVPAGIPGTCVLPVEAPYDAAGLADTIRRVLSRRR
jgi:hypothetical protein